MTMQMHMQVWRQKFHDTITLFLKHLKTYHLQFKEIEEGALLSVQQKIYNINALLHYITLQKHKINSIIQLKSIRYLSFLTCSLTILWSFLIDIENSWNNQFDQMQIRTNHSPQMKQSRMTSF